MILYDYFHILMILLLFLLKIYYSFNHLSSNHLFIYLFIRLLFIYLTIHLFKYSFVYLSIYLFVYYQFDKLILRYNIEINRKNVKEIIEIFDNTTVHSLNLRQQQKVEDEMQILKKKLKKGILSVCLNL